MNFEYLQYQPLVDDDNEFVDGDAGTNLRVGDAPLPSKCFKIIFFNLNISHFLENNCWKVNFQRFSTPKKTKFPPSGPTMVGPWDDFAGALLGSILCPSQNLHPQP